MPHDSNDNLRKCVLSKEVYVACADILGFKDIILHGELRTTVLALSTLLGNKVAAGQLDWATGKTVRPGSIADDGTRLGAYLGYAVFSDTVLLWSLDTTSKSFMALLRACGLLISSGLSNAHHQLPFRVGIASGEAYIDPGAGVYAGKGITKAHLTEQCQDWLGGALCPDISGDEIEPMLRNHLTPLVKHDIPLHTERVDLLHKFIGRSDIAVCWALNWTHHIGNNDYVAAQLGSLATSAGVTNATKYKIALEFYRNYRIRSLDIVD